MKNTICILLLFTLAYRSSAQDRIMEEELRSGYYEDEYETDEGRFLYRGFYKIILLNTYDTIRSLGGRSYEVKYKNATPLLFFSARAGDRISVQDSIWQSVDSTGRITQSEYWNNGLTEWRKEFDSNGNLKEHYYEDYDHDTTFYLTYMDKRLYKKSFFPPGEKNRPTEIFYPDNDLVIDNAQLYFYSIFGDTATVSFPLKLYCKKDISILSVKPGTDNIRIGFSKGSFPYKLTTDDTITVRLIFQPTPSMLTPGDSVTICTSETNVLPYKIYCSLKAVHIDYSTVNKIKEITLSKSKDQYLVLPSMGTITDAFIINAKKERKRYGIKGITKIDLREFDAGEYVLGIYSCNNANDVKLIISE